MRAQVLLAALLLGLGAVLWTRGAAPLGPAPRLRAPVDTSAPDEIRKAPEAPPAPGRDPFRYAGEPPQAPRGGPPPRPPVHPRLPLSAPSAARLVGFIRSAEGLRAALSVDGDLAVVAPGGHLGAYTVLAIDEDAGVRLRGPDGEIVLPPPS